MNTSHFKTTGGAFVVIIIIVIYHYLIQNGIEKSFASAVLPYEFVKRPSESCKTEVKGCVGLPSGHAETVTIFSLLLWFNNFIPLWAALLFILAVSVQRVISRRHTTFQVIVGIIIGTLYSLLYAKTNLPIAILIVLSIGLLLYEGPRVPNHLPF
jgi:hypothetical protein